jgi:hypothetical protein
MCTATGVAHKPFVAHFGKSEFVAVLSALLRASRCVNSFRSGVFVSDELQNKKTNQHFKTRFIDLQWGAGCEIMMLKEVIKIGLSHRVGAC